MTSYSFIARRQIEQAGTLAHIEQLRTKIDNSIHLTEPEKKQAHFQCDGRANVLKFEERPCRPQI